MKGRALVLAILWSFSPVPARAEPFTILPNGDLVFNAALTTHATFRCLQPLSCSGSGTNSVTFGTGADTTTFTFTGVDTGVTIGNSATRVSLGQISFSTTGTGFLFPEIHPARGAFDMTLTLVHSAPVPGTRTLNWRFRPESDTELLLLRGVSYVTFGVGAQPPGFNYTGAVYTVAPFPFRLSADAVRDVTADVGAVPEPATLALVGSGLAAALLRRRRRSSTEG